MADSTSKQNIGIVVLGGSLIREGKRWRTTSFEDEGRFGDRLRVIAAHFLYTEEVKQNPSVVVVAFGSRGRYVAGTPTVASVIKKELMELGIPARAIVIEEKSGTTHEQLRACDSLMAERGWKQAALVSNHYHLLRIKAMIEHAPKLPNLKRGLEQRCIRLISAEKVAVYHDPSGYGKMVKEAYADKAMKERIALEKQGVRDIQAGTYDYGSGGNRTVILRKAALSDARFLYDLRNEEVVRQMSLSSGPFSLRSHQEWLRKKLASGDSVMFIAEVDTIPIGQIRFEVRDDREVEVSLAVCGEHRGKGYGSRIVKGASASFFAAFPNVNAIHAFIKPTNTPSLKVFVEAGYRRMGSAVVKGEQCIDMVLASHIVWSYKRKK